MKETSSDKRRSIAGPQNTPKRFKKWKERGDGTIQNSNLPKKYLSSSTSPMQPNVSSLTLSSNKTNMESIEPKNSFQKRERGLLYWNDNTPFLRIENLYCAKNGMELKSVPFKKDGLQTHSDPINRNLPRPLSKSMNLIPPPSIANIGNSIDLPSQNKLDYLKLYQSCRQVLSSETHREKLLDTDITEHLFPLSELASRQAEIFSSASFVRNGISAENGFTNTSFSNLFPLGNFPMLQGPTSSEQLLQSSPSIYKNEVKIEYLMERFQRFFNDHWKQRRILPSSFDRITSLPSNFAVSLSQISIQPNCIKQQSPEAISTEKKANNGFQSFMSFDRNQECEIGDKFLCEEVEGDTHSNTEKTEKQEPKKEDKVYGDQIVDKLKHGAKKAISNSRSKNKPLGPKNWWALNGLREEHRIHMQQLSQTSITDDCPTNSRNRRSKKKKKRNIKGQSFIEQTERLQFDPSSLEMSRNCDIERWEESKPSEVSKCIKKENQSEKKTESDLEYRILLMPPESR